MSTYEHRVCRSLESDSTHNTLELNPGLTFGILELLDYKDSQFFARYMKKRRWREITPEAHHRQKTYHSTKPPDEELREFETMVPDWFYLSGHYARTKCLIQESPGDIKAVGLLPSGFFNEPFHMDEFVSEWNVRSSQGLFLQTEFFIDSQEKSFRDVWARSWLRSPDGGPNAHNQTEPSETDREQVIQQWWEAWSKPQEDVIVGGTVHPAIRGLLTARNWDDVKVVMLVGCNTLAWPKTGFRTAFPNALFLGYINKNPANATPHIRAFLDNLFQGVTDRRDPKLLDHAHVSNAWMDVHRRQKPTKSNRMAFMDTSDRVFGWKHGKDLAQLGTAESTIFDAEVEPAPR